MRTIKADKLAGLVSSLSVLGLVGNDANRLAKRIHEGPNERSISEFAEIVHNSCRDTINGQQDFLLRVTGMDLLIYTNSGYVVIDYTAGWIDFAYNYGEGQSFADMTRPYRTDEPIDLQDEQDELQIAKVA